MTEGREAWVIVYDDPDPETGICMSGGLRHIITVHDYDGSEQWLEDFRHDYYAEFQQCQGDTFVVCLTRKERDETIDRVIHRFD